MITTEDSITLKNCLALAPQPEEALSYNELTGYLFGLAMSPDTILPSEWIPVIFNNSMPLYDPHEQLEKMSGSLTCILGKLTEDFNNDTLHFPFDISQLDLEDLEPLYEWLSGFEEALALRDNLWDPEQHQYLSAKEKQELYHSLMTIQGLVEPMEMMEYFENIPDEVFKEAFSNTEYSFDNRELQLQMFLLASLPLSIQTLQKHSKTLEKKRRQTAPTKVGNNKKNQQNKIIEVDFTKPRK